MNYPEISKDSVKHLYAAYETLKASPLDPKLRLLAEIYTSQINGCAYCCKLHTADGRKQGIEQEVLDVIPAWRTSDKLSNQQKLVLHWAEALTKNPHELEPIRPQLAEFLSERELVDLTLAISLMNGLNRVAIALRH